MTLEEAAESTFFHYAPTPLTLDARTYEQSLTVKPSGLWVSGGTEWLDWCNSEGFNVEKNAFAHHVTFSETATILTLASAADLLDFTDEYGKQISPSFPSRYVDWARVASEYDGILISPYQWSCRLEAKTFWYYGWDIASGCIWNTAAITIQGVSPVVQVSA